MAPFCNLFIERPRMFRYDEHQFRARSATPKRQLSTRMRVWWSTVLKVALRSSNTRAQILPSSIVLVISSWTAMMEVSV